MYCMRASFAENEIPHRQHQDSRDVINMLLLLVFVEIELARAAHPSLVQHHFTDTSEPFHLSLTYYTFSWYIVHVFTFRAPARVSPLPTRAIPLVSRSHARFLPTVLSITIAIICKHISKVLYLNRYGFFTLPTRPYSSNVCQMASAMLLPECSLISSWKSIRSFSARHKYSIQLQFKEYMYQVAHHWIHSVQ